MIIVVCRDDPGLVTIAINSRQGHPGVFGAVHQVFGNPIPPLGANENLFLISHGVKDGDDGNPTIGGAGDDFWVNAVQLFEALAAGNVFPPGYAGSVFIDACEASEHDEDTFSFTEVFLGQIQARFSQVRVYGRNGVADGLIPPPGSPGWRQA